MSKAGGMTQQDIAEQQMRDAVRQAEQAQAQMVGPAPMPTTWQVGAGQGQKQLPGKEVEQVPLVVMQIQRPSGQDVLFFEIDGKYGVDSLIDQLQKLRTSAKTGLLLPGMDDGQATRH